MGLKVRGKLLVFLQMSWHMFMHVWSNPRTHIFTLAHKPEPLLVNFSIPSALALVHWRLSSVCSFLVVRGHLLSAQWLPFSGFDLHSYSTSSFLVVKIRLHHFISTLCTALNLTISPPPSVCLCAQWSKRKTVVGFGIFSASKVLLLTHKWPLCLVS